MKICMQGKLTLHVQQLKGLRSASRQSPGQLLPSLACTVSSQHGREPLQKARLTVKQSVQLQCTGLSIEGQVRHMRHSSTEACRDVCEAGLCHRVSAGMTAAWSSSASAHCLERSCWQRSPA